MKPLHKVRDVWKELGSRGLLTRAAEELQRRVSDHRTILVLRVDVTNPEHRLRERDRRSPAFAELRLARFDRTTLPDVLAMVEVHEPLRARSVHQRFIEGARGFVAYQRGAPIGYVFWTEGSDHPARLVHGDLRWLGVRPRSDEVYAFDYFVIEPARGAGNLFARSVQEEHFRMGYTGAYGFVLASNRAALWLYRTTGWVEVARVDDHRILGRVAVVGDTVYWLEPLSRIPLLRTGRA